MASSLQHRHRQPFLSLDKFPYDKHGDDGVTTGGKTKKANNFCMEEEEECFRSFIHTSTDSRRGIGQINFALWSIVALHHNCHKPVGGADYPTTSLETKQDDIKVVVARFIGCCWTIKDVGESSTTEDDVVLNVMNLYKQKCGKTFVFKHCWLLLKLILVL